MILKVFLLVCSIVIICETRKSPYSAHILDLVCGNGTDVSKCKEIAAKCTIKQNRALAVQWHARHCDIFKTCMVEIPAALEPYKTFRQEVYKGKDYCASFDFEDYDSGEEDEHDDADNVKDRKNFVAFEDHMAKVSGDAVADSFNCCVGKGKKQFTADAKVNVSAFVEHASGIVDAAARSAYEAGVQSCAATQPPCNILKFKTCVIKKCYETLKQYSP